MKAASLGFEDPSLEPPPPKTMGRHAAQDYQSLLMHVAVVRMLEREQSAPLVKRALETIARWKVTADPRSYTLLDEWVRILNQKQWNIAVAPGEHGNQLRQASPLATLLPQEKRLEIIRRVKALKQGDYVAESA